MGVLSLVLCRCSTVPGVCLCNSRVWPDITLVNNVNMQHSPYGVAIGGVLCWSLFLTSSLGLMLSLYLSPSLRALQALMALFPWLERWPGVQAEVGCLAVIVCPWSLLWLRSGRPTWWGKFVIAIVVLLSPPSGSASVYVAGVPGWVQQAIHIS